MSDAPRTNRRILSIDPIPRGFGFVVFEEPNRPIDWGLKESRVEKEVRSLKQVTSLINLYRPDLIVVEDLTKNTHRSAGARRLVKKVCDLAIKHGVKTKQIKKAELRDAFNQLERVTKESVAAEIAGRFPGIALRLPPPRKPWQGHNPNLAIFHATAMALAALSQRAP